MSRPRIACAPVRGYAAVAPDGGISVATVSPTERAATVNALVVVERARVDGSWSDDDIREVFEGVMAPKGWRIRRVRVEVDEGNDD